MSESEYTDMVDDDEGMDDSSDDDGEAPEEIYEEARDELENLSWDEILENPKNVLNKAEAVLKNNPVSVAMNSAANAVGGAVRGIGTLATSIAAPFHVALTNLRNRIKKSRK